MPKPIEVLVAGATGQQGGAVARALLARGHQVRALTRRPASPAASRLRALGARIVEGDLEEGASIRAAAAGADAFFLMATPFQDGPSAEIRQGMRAAEAARAAGVRHLVYSSVAGADRETGIPHFETKREIEARVAKLGIPYTTVAPVFFMENWIGPLFLGGLRAGRLATPLPAARRLQMVALADLAALVRLVLERPALFDGMRIEVASDERTGPETARVLSRAVGAPIEWVELPLGEVRERSQDLATMFEWLDQVGYRADVAGLRRAWPEVGWHRLEEWAAAQDWTVLDVAPEQPTA